jgi:hypothetical protein
MHNKNLREFYSLADRIKEGLGRACGMNGEKRNAHRVWYVNMKGLEHLEDLDVEGRIL